MPESRPLRADAVKNRARILEAAQRQITAGGPEVPMEAIAADAGVAVGTLYRHFPTKNDLVAAVLETQLSKLAGDAVEAADRVDARSRAFEEFEILARLVMEKAATSRAVKAAARVLGTEYDYDQVMEPGTRAMERLIAAAKADGDLRADLTVADLYLFFFTVPTDQPVPVRERWFQLMMDGFRATGSEMSAAPKARQASEGTV